MSFPKPPGFKVTLKAVDPSVLTPEDLSKQLEAVGLKCSQLTPQTLDAYIQEVKDNIPEGEIESYAILAPPEDLGPAQDLATVKARSEAKATRLAAARAAGKTVHYAEVIGNLVTAATANWEVVEATVDQAALQIIQVRDHFDWLYKNRDTNGFTGIITGPSTYTQYETNETAVKNLFQKVMIEMAAAVVKGLNKSTMEATVTNIINEQVQPSENYHTSGSRVLHLVDGYDSEGRANGIGTLTTEWDLTVENYKKKSKDGGDKHDTTLVVSAWSVLYTDPDTCCKNYNDVLDHFKIDKTSAPKCYS